MVTPDRYSLGIYLGLPAFIIIALLIVGVTALIFFSDIVESNGEAGLTLGMGFFVLLVASAIFTATWFPFDMSFHRWYRVDGPVTEIANRQIAQDGGGMSTRYVFRINGAPYGVDDTRAALVKVGDTVHLKCKKEYVWNSVSGWACNWNG